MQQRSRIYYSKVS